jgi:hypothetical protein
MDSEQNLFGFDYEYQNTVPSGLFGLSRESAPQRMITCGRVDSALPPNRIETSRYNMVTFIPLNLL